MQTDNPTNMNNENEKIVRENSINIVKIFFEFMHKKDIESWGKLWNEDASIIIPYPAKDFPNKITGLSTQILPGFKDLFSKFDTYDYEIKEIYPSTDPEIVIVEWNVKATLKNKDIVYNGQNITVFKLKNGKINQYHDYFNPNLFQIVVDNLK